MFEPENTKSITDAINAHGIFFKRAVRNSLENIDGVSILGEEYPVAYLEGASVDLLVQFSGARRLYVLPVECKRAYAARKLWVFFESPDGNSKLWYYFQGNELQVADSGAFVSEGGRVCIEGIEVDLAKLKKSNAQPYKGASPDPIWKAAFQCSKGGLGFLKKEFKSRKKPNNERAVDFVSFPVIITTARLSVCELNQQNVDVLTGNHTGQIRLTDVNWLILNYPFTPAHSPGVDHLSINAEEYSNPSMRGYHSKEGIIVLNSRFISEFFQLLKRL